jgi:hypothetical protein
MKKNLGKVLILKKKLLTARLACVSVEVKSLYFEGS